MPREAAAEANQEASESGTQAAAHWYQRWQGPQWCTGSWSWGYGSDWQWGAWKKYDGTASEKQPVDLYPEVVPEFIQAWLLLSDANIEISERNLIMTAIQGDLSLQRVAQELRTHFPDSEVQKRDVPRRQQGYLGTGNDEASDLDGEDPESIFQAETELNEEGFAAWTEAEEECQRAMAAMQQARRTEAHSEVEGGDPPSPSAGG